MKITEVKPNQVINLELLTNVIQNKYTGVYVECIATYSMASKYADVAAIHANIVSTLPEGTPKDPTAFSYLIGTMNNEQVVLGLPWINPDVTLVEAVRIRVEFANADMTMVDDIKNALNSRLLTDYTIEVL